MATNDFNPSDSIKTIEDALKQAKAEKTGAAFYYLLWGTILCMHYLLRFIVARYPAIAGNLTETIIWIVFPLGGLISYIRSKKDSKNEKVLSHYEKVYLFAFGGFALAYVTITVASAFEQPGLLNALFPLLLGFTVFTVGGITRHKPSVAGGVLGIICAGISLNVSIEMQYLLAALSSLITCTIPGYLMKNSNV